jgi:signal transduction histidine kinase
MGTITEIRSLAKALVPPMISDLGLRHSIGDLTGTMGSLQGISVELQLDFDEEKLSDVMKLTIFRIIQEQLTNIVKYSKATRAVVSILQRSGEVELAIQDNGVGFNLNEKRKGIGIHNIFKRVESLDGNAEIRTNPGNGCLIFARFPVQRELDAV